MPIVIPPPQEPLFLCLLPASTGPASARPLGQLGYASDLGRVNSYPRIHVRSSQ
jgi:hypothetical protein